MVDHSCPRAFKTVCIEVLEEVVARKGHRSRALVAVYEALIESKAMMNALQNIVDSPGQTIGHFAKNLVGVLQLSTLLNL